MKDNRLKEIKDKKSFDIHIKLAVDDYTELRKRAVDNNMNLSQYVRKACFNESNLKINDDWELYDELRQIKNILIKTGNYMVKVRSLMNGEDFTYATQLMESLKKEESAIDLLRKIIAQYMKKAKKSDDYS